MTSEKSNILYVDDLLENLTTFKYSFQKHYKVTLAQSGEEALKILEKNSSIKVVISDLRMPQMNGVELLEKIQQNASNVIGILLTAYVDIDAIANGINKAKVFGYIQKPFQINEVTTIVNNAIEVYDLRIENEKLLESLKTGNINLQETAKKLSGEIEVRKETEKKLKDTVSELAALKKRLEIENEILHTDIRDKKQFQQIITQSNKYRKVLENIKAVAEKNTTVLITGETGTGKELIANAIHNLSQRSHKPLVKLNCAALPPSVIESELFGHEKGAFTGATEKKIGRFEYADKATIFLDEIAELSLELQSKLLRVLQEGEFQRIGSNKTIKVDVRIISATNKDLKELSNQKLFREDLFYRLNVFPITSIPLRERKEDIPILAEHFIDKYSAIYGLQKKSINEQNFCLLENYSWPGNIRELENVIERYLILSKSPEITFDPNSFKMNKIEEKNEIISSESSNEKERLFNLLEKHSWKIEGKNGVANQLSIPPSTVRYHMKKFGIIRPPKF